MRGGPRKDPSPIRTVPQRETETWLESVARSVALLVRDCPELSAIVEAWPDLPEAIKAGITAMVQAAGDGGEG